MLTLKDIDLFSSFLDFPEVLEDFDFSFSEVLFEDILFSEESPTALHNTAYSAVVVAVKKKEKKKKRKKKKKKKKKKKRKKTKLI